MDRLIETPHPETAQALADSVRAAGLAAVPRGPHGAYYAGDTAVRVNGLGMRARTEIGVRLTTPDGKTYASGDKLVVDREGRPIGESDRPDTFEIYRDDDNGHVDSTAQVLTGKRAEKATDILRRRAARNLLSKAVNTAEERSRRVEEIISRHAS